MVGLMRDLQTFQFKYGLNGYKHVVPLRDYRPVGNFASAALDFNDL
jgi:hypothetical protein